MRMTDPAGETGSRTIAAVEKACDIVECLHELDGATLTEIADNLDLTPGTVHPHLMTLVENEVVVKQNQEYHPSFQFLTIIKTRQQQNPLYKYGIDEIDALAEEENARSQLYVEEFGRAVCIGIGGSEKGILPPTTVGEQTPLHCIAAGKAILAAYPEDRTESILDHRGLPQMTDNTMIDRNEFHEALREVSEREYALNDEEYMPGLRAVGAPVTGPGGDVLGAISVSKPTKELDEAEFKQGLPQQVAKIANRIEVNIQVGESN